MDPDFTIPPAPRAMSHWRICLIMGLTALLLVLLAARMDDVAALIAPTQTMPAPTTGAQTTPA